MLDLIVMGEIPGTHTQVTFFGLLVALLATTILAVLVTLIFDLITRNKRYETVDFNLISI